MLESLRIFSVLFILFVVVFCGVNKSEIIFNIDMKYIVTPFLFFLVLSNLVPGLFRIESDRITTVYEEILYSKLKSVYFASYNKEFCLVLEYSKGNSKSSKFYLSSSRRGHLFNKIVESIQSYKSENIYNEIEISPVILNNIDNFSGIIDGFNSKDKSVISELENNGFKYEKENMFTFSNIILIVVCIILIISLIYLILKTLLM